MAQKNFMRACKSCSKPTMHIQQKPNHILHLLMCVFTIGLWVIVWAWVSLVQEKPQCTVCGSKPGLFQ